jgi:general secretion pathway protein D
MNQRFHRFVRALALSFAVLWLTASAADQERVTLNLKDADINALIATVSEVTGKNFIVDPRVKGKVTVISSTPMDAAGVYETFLAVLEVEGYAAVRAGEAIKIIPEVNARSDGGSGLSSGAGLPQDDVVTHVYQPQNASAQQLVNILRPLVAQNGNIQAYPPSNVVIISDRASNVLRLDKLMQQIDAGGDHATELVPLTNAAADDVVKTLTALQQQDKAGDPTARSATAIADERSNSILLGGDKDDREKMKQIIERLDTPLKEDAFTQVIYLNYASAESLAPVLQGYAQQKQTKSQTKTSGGYGSSSGGSSFGGSSNGSSGFGFGSNNSSSTASASPSASPASSGSYGGGAGGGGGNLDRTTIVAERDTNSLVISAPPKTMKMLRSVIAQLDVRRPQVHVEAIIAEISADRASNLGVDWAVYNPHSIAATGIVNDSTASVISSAASSLGSTTNGETVTTSNLIGAAAGLLTSGATAAIGKFSSNGTSFAALLKALATDGNTNILSTPSETVLNNQEAKISVGQEVPFLTGSFSNTGTASNGAVNPFQTIDRKDVGLSLAITPTVTKGDTLTLEIEIENSSLSSGTAGSSNLITNKRTISTSVSVGNGQILVLGGLIDNQLNDSTTRIPLLSSLPLLGNLFKSTSITHTKRNLMVFIHPVILRQPGDGDYYTRLKYDSVRKAELDTADGAVPLVGGGRPMLYDYDEYLKQNALPGKIPGDLDPNALPPLSPASDATGTDHAHPK